MSVSEFLPFAAGDGANTLSAAQYAAIGPVAQGFQSGIALSIQMNTVLRQVSTIAAALGQFTADNQGSDVLDDGVPANFEAKFGTALKGYLSENSVHYGIASGTGDALVVTAVPPIQTTTTGAIRPGTLLFVLTPTIANTGTAPTLNANSIGNVAVTKRNGAAVSAGDVPASTDVAFFFNGAAWTIVGQAPSDSVSSVVTALNVVGGRQAFFSTPGTFTWTCPTGVTKVELTLQSAGGAGGGGAANGMGSGAGGSGGNWAQGVFDVISGQDYTVIVGAGGTCASVGSNGTNGGTTSFGPLGGTIMYAESGGGGGGHGGNSATVNVGIATPPSPLSGATFPHGGQERQGGFASNGLSFPTTPTTYAGGIGAGSASSPTTVFPIQSGAFSAPSYGGGGSGGAGNTAGGAGGGGFVLIEF